MIFRLTSQRRHRNRTAGTNLVKASIPTFLWTEAVERGRSLTARDGVRGAERLDNDIKLIYAVASNVLINQHANINRTARLLGDERRVEFIAVQDQVLTPSARFADLVLPACTQFETWGVEDGWKYGDEVLLMPKVVDPPGEARSDYRISAGIASRLGLGPVYTEGRDERGWVEWSLARLREALPGCRRWRSSRPPMPACTCGPRLLPPSRSKRSGPTPLRTPCQRRPAASRCSPPRSMPSASRPTSRRSPSTSGSGKARSGRRRLASRSR